jgi:hypothetical protein
MMTQKLPPPPKDYTTSLIDELIKNIHVITGWRLPKTEYMLLILCRQLQKKLHFDYPGISHDEIENAFHKYGGEENFTGSLNISTIDRVLKKYFASKAQMNFDEERKIVTQTIPIPLPSEHLSECRALLEHKYQLYLVDEMEVELLPAFIWPVLQRDFKIDPELPLQFTGMAKEFIRERSESRKITRQDAITATMSDWDHSNTKIDDVSVKLAISYCFFQLRQMHFMHLYQKCE